MNEAEFRSQLDALGRKYQDHIRDMNTVDSPGFKKKHQALAHAAVDEIAALEKKREAAKAYDYIRARDRFMAQSHEPMVVADPVVTPEYDLEYWRERKVANLKEGAHIDVIRYIERQIHDLQDSATPINPNRGFSCPECGQVGTVYLPTMTISLPGHEYLGDGKFYCYHGPDRRIFQEPTLFQPTAQPPDNPDTLSWIDYHDRLVKEWFDGERKLVDDLYPSSAPRPAKKKSNLPIAVAVAIPIAMFIVLWVWMAKQMFGF